MFKPNKKQQSKPKNLVTITTSSAAAVARPVETNNRRPKIIIEAQNHIDTTIPDVVSEKMSDVYDSLRALEQGESLNKLIEDNLVHWSTTAHFANIFRCRLWNNWRVICAECRYPLIDNNGQETIVDAILIRVFNSMHNKNDTLYKAFLTYASNISKAAEAHTNLPRINIH